MSLEANRHGPLRSAFDSEGGGDIPLAPVSKANPNHMKTSAEPVATNSIRSLSPNVRHEDNWNRTPNTPGTGAIHVKSFRCKLSDESLDYLDRQVNEWLDAHPQYEVKLVTSSIGDFQTKMGREQQLVIQVWV